MDEQQHQQKANKLKNDLIRDLESKVRRRGELLKEALDQLKMVEWEVNLSVIVRIEKELENG